MQEVVKHLSYALRCSFCPIAMFFYTDDEKRRYRVHRWFNKIDLYVVYLPQLLFKDFEVLFRFRTEFDVDGCSQIFAYLFLNMKVLE